MAQKRTVLVTGATGKQGGAVARALLKRGHNVLALTRAPQSAAACDLQRAGAEVVAGDFDAPGGLAAAAGGVDTLFAMGTPFGSSVEDEGRQGIALIEAAKTAGVGHVIYSSVASADAATGVPHFDSKYEVEERLKSSGLAYTISAPVAFMDFLNPFFLQGLREGELRMALPPSRALHYVSVADIGCFVAELIERREGVFGQRFEIAGDEATGEEAAAALSRASGKDIRYVALSPDVIRAHSEDLAAMFEWFDRTGYSVDRGALQRAFPDIAWQSIEDWARAQDWRGALDTVHMA